MYDYKDVPLQNCIDDYSFYETANWVCDADTMKASFDVESVKAQVEYEAYEQRLKEWN